MLNLMPFNFGLFSFSYQYKLKLPYNASYYPIYIRKYLPAIDNLLLTDIKYSIKRYIFQHITGYTCILSDNIVQELIVTCSFIS